MRFTNENVKYEVKAFLIWIQNKPKVHLQAEISKLVHVSVVDEMKFDDCPKTGVKYATLCTQFCANSSQNRNPKKQSWTQVWWALCMGANSNFDLWS